MIKTQDLKNISSIQALSLDIFALNKNNANCGLDSALKMAPILYFLYKNHINFNPKKPDWVLRDGLFFSQGYASPLLYSSLYHFGYDLNMEDLKKFGKNNSKTPMILDSRKTPGVEAITYPIGIDIAQAVGYAFSQKFLSRKLNSKTLPHTFVICAEETMHNGKTMESMSFAGHFKLNNITIINVCLYSKAKEYFTTFSDNLNLRTKSINWNYEEISLTHNSDYKKINEILKNSKNSLKPTLINIHTNNLNKISLNDLMCPLSKEQWEIVKKEVGYKNKESFSCSKNVKKSFQNIINDKIKNYQIKHKKFIKKYKDDKVFQNIFNYDRAKLDLRKFFNIKIGKHYYLSTHNNYCQKLDIKNQKIKIDIRKFLHKKLISYIDGTGQILNSGIMQGYNTDFDKENSKNILYGVRDDSIASIVSGMAISKYMHPAWFTSISFLNYSMASIRNQAISGHNVLNVFNYSFSIKNPSPHQRIAEQISFLRATPNLVEWKPIDAHEIILSYNMYLKSKTNPTAILIPKDKLKTISSIDQKSFQKGAYILKKETTRKFITIISSGYEMQVIYKQFANYKYIRIVSMPSVSTFRRQPLEFRDSILGSKENAIFVDVGNDHSLYEFSNIIIGISKKMYANNSKKLSIISLQKLIEQKYSTIKLL